MYRIYLQVTVFDFSEIMERTEKRVGDEVLGSGPQTVEELRAIARRVKSKYLLRIQSKEKHMMKRSSPQKQLSSILNKESTKNVTNAVIGGVGGLATMWKSNSTVSDSSGPNNNASTAATPVDESPPTPEKGEVEIQYVDPIQSQTEPQTKPQLPEPEDVLSEAFDLLGGDFSNISTDDLDHDQELLDAMDIRIDGTAAFAIDDDVFKI